MATITQYAPGNAESIFLSIAGRQGNYYLNGTGTSFAWDNGGTSPWSVEGSHLLVGGYGFSWYYDDEELYPYNAGTATSFTILTAELFPLVTITDVSVPMAQIGAAFLYGSAANLRNFIAGQSWTYNGSAGDDTINGGNFADTINANSGVDTVHGLDGDDFIYGDAGNDFLHGDAGNDTIFGGTGDDTIEGWSDNDTLYGGDGGDLFYGNSGDDTIYGEAGQDTVWAAENNDTVYGGADSDTLYGESGIDFLDGGAGNDVLNGGADADTMVGGAGNDTHFVESATDIVVELTNGGTDAVNSSLANHTLGQHVENLFLTGSAPINGTGNSLGNEINGNSNVNILIGAAGDDILRGGDDADVLDGGADRDAASYADALAGVTADLAVATNNTGDAAGDTYLLIEDLIGSNLVDNLRGDGGANRLFGGLGNDILAGRSGNDVLIGGGGGDRLDGQAGEDAASYSYAADAVLADLQAAAGNTGEALGDTYSAIEDLIGSNYADSLRGDGNANRVSGGLGADKLYGRDGADTLRGGAGMDTLYGGAQADIFVFDQALIAANVDRIVDFEAADFIHIDNAVFAGLAAGALGSTAFLANTTGNAENSSQRIIYETDTGELYFDRDGTGNAFGSVHFATLTNFATLGVVTASDFVVI